MRRAFTYVGLPAEVTRSEASHLERANRVAPRLLIAAAPLVALLAWHAHTGALLASELAAGLAVASWLAGRAHGRPRLVSMLHGVSAMVLAALLVHFARGPQATEMFAAFFVFLATLVVFGNPRVILAAAATAALLDGLVLHPEGAALATHLGFLALEAAAGCLVARSFFDNLIGLEKTVRTRTLEFERKTRDLELFLDTVDQGFVTLTEDGAMVASSAAFVRSFPGDRTDTFFDRLGRHDVDFAEGSRASWEQVAADVLPAPLALAQMPSRLVSRGRTYRIEYRPVDSNGPKLFVAVISDVSSELAHEAAEQEKREGLLLVQRALADRVPVGSFLAEGRRAVEQLLAHRSDTSQLTQLRRGLHTLKGNAAVLGITSISAASHTLETRLADQHGRLTDSDVAPVIDRFQSLDDMIAPLLAHGQAPSALRDKEVSTLEVLVRRDAPKDMLLAALAELRLEPVQAQLDHLGDHARELAVRLGRAALAVTVEAHDARMSARDSGTFFAAFVHLVHNAVDHGIETESERRAGGKELVARIHLRAGEESGSMFIEIEDDGRGIDWARVEARASELGLPAPLTGSDALFADGVSTVSHASALSGRGIGMGAVRAAIDELHGALTIHSAAGKGTRIRATLPLPL